jgi:hypothetical protein
MKTFNNFAAQGDVYFRRISILPENMKKIEPENGKYIITHSETGHHHVMNADTIEMYELPDSLKALLVVNSDTELEHLRSHDTHESIMFSPGIYEVRRQREYVAEGFRKAQD